MKRFIATSILILILSNANAQVDLESIKNKLTNEKTKTQVDLRNQLAYELIKKNPDQALDLTDSAEMLSKDLNYKVGELTALINKAEILKIKKELDQALKIISSAEKKSIIIKSDSLNALLLNTYGNILRSLGNYDESLSKYNLALQKTKSTHNQLLESSILNNIGNVYLSQSNNEKALDYYLKALELIEPLGKEKEISSTLGNISLVYKNTGQYEKSISYGKKASAMALKIENFIGAGINFANLSNAYRQLKLYDSALYYIEKSNEMCKKTNNTNGLIINRINAGSIYYSKQNYNNSITFYLEALEQLSSLQKPGNESIIQTVTRNIGHCYFELGQYSKAYAFFEKALAYKELSKNLENEKEIHYALYTVNKKLNFPDKALAHHEKYYELQDSINEMNNLEKIEQLETNYQIKSQEKEIELLTKENLLAEQQAKTEKSILLFVIVLIASLSIMLYLLYKNRQKVAKRLQELDKLKSNFFTNISHEFRTPLTLIKEPIEELSANGLPHNQRDKLAIANRNADRLLELVDQLLELSKLESGNKTLSIEELSIQYFIATLLPSFEYAAKRKEIDFISDVSDFRDSNFFDRDVLEKIIVNLLSNAIKYTPGGETIKFSASIKNNNLQIQVYNTGSGLNKNEKQRIFERFYQRDDHQPGAGIGLALTKELVLLHKGTIKVESDEQSWVSLEVSLPVSKNSYSQKDLAKTTSKEKANIATRKLIEEPMHILPEEDEVLAESDQPILLLVEDNAELQVLLYDLFKSDYQVIQAKDGLEGAEKAFEYIPDLIISDVMMPLKDGYELTNQLKTDERTSHIPVILLTARSGEDNEVLGLENGADAYIVKPFNRKTLLLQAKKLIELRAKLRSRYSQELILKPKDIAITTTDEKFLDKVQQLFDDQLTETEFSSEIFSREIGMSRMQLHRKLKALTGLSTSAFIRSQRLKLAATLLEKDSSNISDIAYAVGFNDLTYFIRCFKEAYHTTPKKFTKTSA